MDRLKNDDIRGQLNLKSVEQTIEVRQLSWLGHLLRMEEGRLTRRVYGARSTGKNKVGRPRLKWEDQVRKAAERRNIKWRDIGNAVQDRNGWKRIIREL